MNPFLIGAALGKLSDRGSVDLRVGDDWYTIHADTLPAGENDAGTIGWAEKPVLSIDDVFLLLQAEDVKM